MCLTGGYVDVQTTLGSGQQISWVNPRSTDYQVMVTNATSKLVGLAVDANITGSVNFTVSVFSGAQGKSGTFLGNLTGNSISGRRRSTVSTVNVAGRITVTAYQPYSLVFFFSSNSGGSGLIGVTHAQYPPEFFYNSQDGSNNTNVIFAASLGLQFASYN